MPTKQGKQVASNFMTIKFSTQYDEYIILPHKAGVMLLAALENAQLYIEKYQHPACIRDLEKDDVKSNIIGAQEYAEAILRSTLLAEAAS